MYELHFTQENENFFFRFFLKTDSIHWSECYFCEPI